MTTHTTKNALARLLSVLLLVFAAFAGQARALEVPPYEGPVNDRAGFLAEADRARLNADLEALGRDTGVRIAVLTIPSLEGEDLNAFFLKTAQTWGKEVTAGDKDILLLVSSKEGAVRMAVGPGLDTALYNRVLAEETFPYFKARRAGEGLASGLTAMARAARTGTFTPGATARELAAAAQPAAKPAAPPAPQPDAQTAEQAAALVIAQTVTKPAGQGAAKPDAQPAEDPDDVQAQGLKVPRLTGPVNDLAGVLSPETRERLAGEMRALNRESGIQIAVLTIPSLQGEVLEEFSMKTATAWGLGKKGEDNGVLFLVAMKERKIRIEVGYGLEGKLTDLLCGRIIRDEIAPAFKAGHPDEGVANGVAALMRAAKDGEFAPSAAALAFAKSVKEKQRNMFILGLGLVFVNVLLGVGAYLRKRPAMRQAAFREDLEQVKDKHLGIMCLLSAVVAIVATLLLGYETRETVFGIVLCVVCGALGGPILYFFTLYGLAPDGKGLPWRNSPVRSGGGSSSSYDDDDDYRRSSSSSSYDRDDDDYGGGGRFGGGGASGGW